jgi:hypothetical protein
MMSIFNCRNCGGTHYGSNKCPYINAPCVVCGDPTILACADCSIESGGKISVHVCSKGECRDAHEAANPQHPRCEMEPLIRAAGIDPEEK